MESENIRNYITKLVFFDFENLCANTVLLVVSNCKISELFLLSMIKKV